MSRPLADPQASSSVGGWWLWARRKVWVVQWLDGLRQNFWFTPLLCTLTAPILAYGLLMLDSPTWLDQPSEETQRTFYSMIAGTMVAVAASTFTLVMAVLSLASNQFGPRLIGQFLKDGVSQVTLGALLGVASFHTVALLFAPATPLVFHASLLAALVGVVVLVLFLQHLARSVHADTVVDRVSDDLDDTLRTLCNDAPARIPPAPFPHVIVAESAGYLQAVDQIDLRRCAIAMDRVVQVVPRPGQFVLEGEPLLRTDRPVDDPAPLLDAMWLGTARSSTQDIEFVFEQLAEMAVRALSPGINDPYTARRCIDRIASGLALFLRLGPPDPALLDEDDQARVWIRWPDYEDVRAAGTARIRHAARDDPATLAHLEDVLARVARRHDDDRRSA